MFGGSNSKEAYGDLHVFYPHSLTWAAITDAKVCFFLPLLFRRIVTHIFFPGTFFFQRVKRPLQEAVTLLLDGVDGLSFLEDRTFTFLLRRCTMMSIFLKQVWAFLFLLFFFPFLFTLFFLTETNTWKNKRLKITASESSAYVVARHACGMMGPSKVSHLYFFLFSFFAFSFSFFLFSFLKLDRHVWRTDGGDIFGRSC